MKTCRILMPIGSLGAGINPEAFENGLTMKPDVIAVDAGSTDSGPAYLATGTCKYSRAMLKHDLEICIAGGKKLGIPVFVGSCGTCGTDNMVDLFAEIVEEIYRERGFTGRIARIYSQQDPNVLKKKFDEGKIYELEGAPVITKETFDECTNIVALMGAEPYIKAYEEGAEVVLGGRTTDTAIIAAMPIKLGCHVGAAWHGAKVVECGAQCTEDTEAKGVFLTVDEKGFLVTTLLPWARCTPYSVSAHMLYENVDPYRLTEPSGIVTTNEAVYTQVDERSVYVTGSKFEQAKQYTMKLEGACLVGYQTISLVGIADRAVMAEPESWIKNISEYVDTYIRKLGISPEDYSFNFKAYGYNAVIDGPVPAGTPAPREIGVLLTVTAKTQDLANQISKVFNPYLLHFPADPNVQLPSFAFPFSPAHIPRGATYEFKLYHIVKTEGPFELVRFKYNDIK